MKNTLSITEIVDLVANHPEQAILDWKTDFVLPRDDVAKGELVKDIVAIANAAARAPGYLIYGVDPRRPTPVIGVSTRYDDARLQQLVDGKVEPPIDFLYYEVACGEKWLAVIRIGPTYARPHIVCMDLGKIRKGQILVRRGSSTDGIRPEDLMQMFYGQDSDHFSKVIQKLQLDVQQQQATNEHIKLLRQQAHDALRDMELTAGLPRGSLGSE